MIGPLVASRLAGPAAWGLTGGPKRLAVRVRRDGRGEAVPVSVPAATPDFAAGPVRWKMAAASVVAAAAVLGLMAKAAGGAVAKRPAAAATI